MPSFVATRNCRFLPQARRGVGQRGGFAFTIAGVISGLILLGRAAWAAFRVARSAAAAARIARIGIRIGQTVGRVGKTLKTVARIGGRAGRHAAKLSKRVARYAKRAKKARRASKGKNRKTRDLPEELDPADETSAPAMSLEQFHKRVIKRSGRRDDRRKIITDWEKRQTPATLAQASRKERMAIVKDAIKKHRAPKPKTAAPPMSLETFHERVLQRAGRREDRRKLITDWEKLQTPATLARATRKERMAVVKSAIKSYREGNV